MTQMDSIKDSNLKQTQLRAYYKTVDPIYVMCVGVCVQLNNAVDAQIVLYKLASVNFAFRSAA